MDLSLRLILVGQLSSLEKSSDDLDDSLRAERSGLEPVVSSKSVRVVIAENVISVRSPLL